MHCNIQVNCVKSCAGQMAQGWQWPLLNHSAVFSHVTLLCRLHLTQISCPGWWYNYAMRDVKAEWGETVKVQWHGVYQPICLVLACTKSLSAQFYFIIGWKLYNQTADTTNKEAMLWMRRNGNRWWSQVHTKRKEVWKKNNQEGTTS